MEAPKPLILGTLAVTAWGVGYDILVNAGVIAGDGHDHTVPYVAAAASTGTQTISSGVIFASVNNSISGDEIPVPAQLGTLKVYMS